MTPKILHNLALSLALTLGIAACATPGQEEAPRRSKTTAGLRKPKPTAGTPVAVGNAGESGASGTAAANVQVAPVADDLAQFVIRAGTPTGPFTESDRQMLTRIPSKPSPGSVQEAAVAVGVLRTVYNPATARPAKFEESDLGNGLTANKASDPATTAPSELESEATARGIDFAGAVETNPYLQTEGVFQLTLAAMSATAGGSPEGGSASTGNIAFSERLKGAMAQRVRAWMKFGEDHGLLPKGNEIPPTPAIAAPNSGTPPSPQQPGPGNAAAVPLTANGIPMPAGDVIEAEGVLNDAQAMADRGEYDGAIAQVMRVSKDSPQYPLAQEKLKTISNKAVHTLRTKAAQAYTSAAPVNDPQTRASYLERAKGFLLEALNKYPAADQLATVRDNLAVITRDLSKISQPGAAGDQQQ